MKKVAYGENSRREYYDGCCYGIHAELSSVKHLQRSKSTRNKYWDNKRLSVDLLVIRINNSGKLCSSKPCENCIKKLSMITVIKIKNVYYSTSDGEIVSEKFNKLKDSPHISRSFRKK